MGICMFYVGEREIVSGDSILMINWRVVTNSVKQQVQYSAPSTQETGGEQSVLSDDKCGRGSNNTEMMMMFPGIVWESSVTFQFTNKIILPLST